MKTDEKREKSSRVFYGEESLFFATNDLRDDHEGSTSSRRAVALTEGLGCGIDRGAVALTEQLWHYQIGFGSNRDAVTLSEEL